jgi:hypothetical protein
MATREVLPMKHLRPARFFSPALLGALCMAVAQSPIEARAQDQEPAQNQEPEPQQPEPQQPDTSAQGQPAPAQTQGAQVETSQALPPTVALDPGVRPPPASDLSAQNAAIELRFGRYVPRVDDGVESPVFEDFFGDDNRYLLGFELDWQIWRAPYVGTLGVGAGWGYTSISAPNQPTGQEGVPNEQPIAQESTLSIMPMYAVGVLRVDVLSRQLGVPLVPYGKLGLGYAFWWVNDGIATARNNEGVAGKDISVGTHAALGGMLLLDTFDPVAARAMDAEAGINNSYIFFEWLWSDFDGDQMNVGASTWMTGLAIEL